MTSRRFKNHKGKGGLMGTARFFDDQGAGRRNHKTREFLERSPVQGSRVIRVIDKILPVTPVDFSEGGSQMDVDTVALRADGLPVGPVFGRTSSEAESQLEADGLVVGPVFGGAVIENESQQEAAGQVVGPILGASFAGNASLMVAAGTVV